MNNFQKITASQDNLIDFIEIIIDRDCGICPAAEYCTGDCRKGMAEYLEDDDNE